MNVSALSSPAPVAGVGASGRVVAAAETGVRPTSPPKTASLAREFQASLVERARNAAQQIESFVRSQGRDLEFRVDDSTGAVVVLVRDASTGEVIRQIPNEAALRFAERLASAAPDNGGASVLLDEVV
jgi:flagellar protein FlaG